MCTKSLFYFKNPLGYGPPAVTCLHKLVQHISDDSIPLGLISVIVGLQCLFLFFAHFALYQRPVPESENDENFHNQFATRFKMAKYVDPHLH